MPWHGPAQFPYEFESILRHAPMQPGLDAIFAGGKWLYVGEADNLCGRLLYHLGLSHSGLARHQPAHFAFEVSPPRPAACGTGSCCRSSSPYALKE